MPANFKVAAKTFASIAAMYADEKALGHTTAQVGVDTAPLMLTFGAPQKIDRLKLVETELPSKGQQVMKYIVEAQTGTTAGAWQALSLNSGPNSTACAPRKYSRCGGLTIGSHHLDALEPAVEGVTALRLKVLETITAGARPSVSLQAFHTVA